ncbi:pyrroloquinoline quinone biosynthesis peptide chaperone PqqD [Pseudonocardia kujensis]|uniref:pyrroloquinoline quinone biosynthesis peptide chaperone PqqD n=1 Tax=Pseudonocardia kujensis TaxID=1128675 RepID=UPI001E482764|nr:pyrroloquinoline quinone biosynthesis peptide chaperone PqqD [Pseudonocardia kujensis]MCE0768297.1 pyrroloquinoline quinone biosynthesis peptide chaperone PqqD [Pseudonocardia kujensis]
MSSPESVVAGAVPASGRPRLARHVRLTFDPSRERHVLLRPECVVVLNRTGADILDLCDGSRTVAGIVTELRGRYARVAEADVQRFLAGLVDRRCVVIDPEATDE